MKEIEEFKNLIQNDNVAGVRNMIARGANKNAIDVLGYTPLHWAAIKGKVEIIEALLQNAVDKNPQCTNYKFSPLHCAINENQNGAINVLLNAGVNIMAKDKDGNTPLHFASMHGNDAIVHKLIALGANVNATDSQGVTPIFLANYCGHTNIARILRNAGAQ